MSCRIRQGGGPCPAEQPVGKARCPGNLEGRRSAAAASKATWPRPQGRKKSWAGVSAVQQETALQRLLALHRAARHQLQQDREQQRLWVHPAREGAGHRRRPPSLTALPARSWNASASPGTATAGCTPLPPLGVPTQSSSAPTTGGQGGAAACPAGAAGTGAPEEDQAPAGPRSQEHPELPAATLPPWRRGACARRVALSPSNHC